MDRKMVASFRTYPCPFRSIIQYLILKTSISFHCPFYDTSLSELYSSYICLYSCALSMFQKCPTCWSPPCSLRARTVATISTTSGCRPEYRHLMLKNFSRPTSAPQPASVTAGNSEELGHWRSLKVTEGHYTKANLGCGASQRSSLVVSLIEPIYVV